MPSIRHDPVKKKAAYKSWWENRKKFFAANPALYEQYLIARRIRQKNQRRKRNGLALEVVPEVGFRMPKAVRPVECWEILEDVGLEFHLFRKG